MSNNHNLPMDQENFLREVLKRLGSFHEDMLVYAQNESFFSSKVAKELKQIKSVLSQTIGHIQEDFEALNGGDDPISFLLSQLTDALDDISFFHFRQAILKNPPIPSSHFEILQTEQYPVYLSDLPSLPHGATTVSIRVTLNHQEHFDRIVALTLPVSDFIATTIKELSLPYRPQSVVCKAIGFNEYICGEKSLSSFQCVREAVRKRHQLNINFLVRKDLDPSYVDRIITLGKQLHKEFVQRAGKSIDDLTEDLVVADDEELDIDFDKVQNQRLASLVHNKDVENSLIGNVYNHGFGSSSDEEIFSTVKRSHREPSLSYSALQSTTSPHHGTPSKRRNQPHGTGGAFYGRDRTPSPEPQFVKNIPQGTSTTLTLDHFNTPSDPIMAVKVVPLSLALNHTKSAEWDLAEEEYGSKRISALQDIPEIFKRTLHPDDKGTKTSTSGSSKKSKNNPDDLTDESTDDDVVVYDTTGKPIISMFTEAPIPTILNISAPGSNKMKNITVTSVSAPPQTPTSTAIQPSAIPEDLHIGDFDYQVELEQERYAAMRQAAMEKNNNSSNNNSNNSNQGLIDSDEEEFAALAKREKEVEAGRIVAAQLAKERGEAEKREKEEKERENSPLVAEIPTDELESMFGGAARSPHKRMGRASISVSGTTGLAGSMVSPSSSSAANNGFGPAIVEELSDEENMFGGASRAPNKRRARASISVDVSNDTPKPLPQIQNTITEDGDEEKKSEDKELALTPSKSEKSEEKIEKSEQKSEGQIEKSEEKSTEEDSHNSTITPLPLPATSSTSLIEDQPVVPVKGGDSDGEAMFGGAARAPHKRMALSRQQQQKPSESPTIDKSKSVGSTPNDNTNNNHGDVKEESLTTSDNGNNNNNNSSNGKQQKKLKPKDSQKSQPNLSLNIPSTANVPPPPSPHSMKKIDLSVNVGDNELTPIPLLDLSQPNTPSNLDTPRSRGPPPIRQPNQPLESPLSRKRDEQQEIVSTSGVKPGQPEIGSPLSSAVPPPPSKPRPSAPTQSQSNASFSAAGSVAMSNASASAKKNEEEEDEEESDQIAPLPSANASTPANSPQGAGGDPSPLNLKNLSAEQMLAHAANSSLTLTASSNFFKSAPSSNAPSATAVSTTQSGSGNSLFNRRGSVAQTGTLGKGSLFRYQNSTIAPSDLGDLPAISEQFNQVEMACGKLFVPKLSPTIMRTVEKGQIIHSQTQQNHDSFDENEPLLLDFSPTTFSSQEQTLPMLHLSIVGADNINLASCPRLSQFSGIPAKYYIASCIIAGDAINQFSVTSTHEIDQSTSPRWNERILPTSRAIPFHNVLRESKIAFVLVARFANNKTETKAGESFDVNNLTNSTDVPLAWCCQQMIHENDQFLSGTQHLSLWPLGYKDESDQFDQFTTRILGASQVLVETTRDSQTIGPTNTIDDKKDKKEKKKKKEKQMLELSRMNPNMTKGIDLQLQSYIFRGVNCPNFYDDAATLTVQFNSFNAPITKPHETPSLKLTPHQIEQQIAAYKALSRDDLFHLQVLEAEDALYSFSDEDRALVWAARHKISTKPHMLHRFVSCINTWGASDQKQELYAIMNSWVETNSITHIIPLLDAQFQDFEIRRFAVERLKKFSHGHIQMYLLQLTQCLKFEPYHNGPLSQFLLSLSIQHPNQIGHFFYWNLKNETAADPPFFRRFRALLEVFLTFCPMATEQLRTQQQIIDECKRMALSIQRTKGNLSDKELETNYRDMVTSFNRDFLQRLPNGFQIPLDPRWEAVSLVPEKCKIMSSKMAPLWLVFQNKDVNAPDPYFYVIFKGGDDLRQDILTLQILRFMDEAWLEAKLDLRLSPYNVIATGVTEDGRGTGMIQVVLNSLTTAGIQRTYGGGASGAFQEDTIWQFLKEHNPTKEKLDAAVHNFQLSCVGYCVATYILGIGDRHNGNIMVTKDGHLFHIDFGHFLGNFKSKFGMNRERAAFVCTPEMIYAACGGSNDQNSAQFEQFTRLCLDAFSIIRQKASELESLFVSMVSAGLPECLSKGAILYIRRQMVLELTEKQARDAFKAQLFKALNSTSRKIDNWFHLIKHDSKA